MEPVIQISEETERKFIEVRLARARERVERAREDTFGKSSALEEVEDWEFKLANLTTNTAIRQQELTDRALSIDDRRSMMEHREKWLRAMEENTAALLEVAKAIASR